MRELVELLREKNLTISTMESCTGGGVANAITSIEGASDILKFSAVTYSNEFKIKMGVDKDVIEKYSVYSMETANEMSKNISLFTGSDIGVGITGKLNRADKNNMFGEDNKVFVSIYLKNTNEYKNFTYTAKEQSRAENKELIIQNIANELKRLI
jgi:PncC family amidohydrolase